MCGHLEHESAAAARRTLLYAMWGHQELKCTVTDQIPGDTSLQFSELINIKLLTEISKYYQFDEKYLAN